MTTKQQRLNDKIKTHGLNLCITFGLPEQDPVKLAKSLFRIENAGNRACLDYCNGNMDCDHLSEVIAKLKKRVVKILGKREIYYNTDPRGCFLKLESIEALPLPRDMGGYYLLAPDLRSK